MLTVVCFKWFDPQGRYNDRLIYSADHVNRLKRMVDRNLALPHDFACITDDATGLDPQIRAIALESDLVLKFGHRFPKLTIFRPDAADWLGRRILMLDLDTIIVGKMDALLDRPDDFVAWQEPTWGRKAGRGKYNSSMVLLTAGSHPEVWQRFQSADGASPAAQAQGFSDQALISEVLGDKHPVWTREDGILSFKRDMVRKRLLTRKRDPSLPTRLPPNARIVFFHGGIDATAADFQARHTWVREHVA
jgi:hypothetical protein